MLRLTAEQQQKKRAAAVSAMALVDAGATPLWHPPASLQDESSLRSTLACNHDNRPRHNAIDVPTSLSQPVERQTIESEPLSPIYTYHTSFAPITKHPASNPESLASSHGSIPRVLPTTSETFRKRYGKHIPAIDIDMYEVGEHELDTLNHDEGRVYHVGLNVPSTTTQISAATQADKWQKGGSYSGRFVEQPLKPELGEMVSKTITNKAENISKVVVLALHDRYLANS